MTHFSRLVWCLLGASSVSLACGETFEPGSLVQELRVLGVRKSQPYARPGEEVALHLLWHDSRPSPQTPPQIAWFALCDNPDGDLFELCFAQLGGAAAASVVSPESLEQRVSLPTSADAANDRFRFTVREDIISGRPPPKDPDVVPYGLSFVFFAVCAGRLGLAADPTSFPVACYEPDGRAGFETGEAPLGPDRFVVGYSSVFAYDSLRNTNPSIQGIRLDDVDYFTADAEAPAGALRLPASDFCVGDTCEGSQEPQPGPCSARINLRACGDTCAAARIQPLITPSDAEVDTVASGARGSRLGEQMWVNYYGTSGELGSEVRLLNDAVLGWNDASATTFTPGAESGPAWLWTVVHDNRGGADWARLRVCVQEDAP